MPGVPDQETLKAAFALKKAGRFVDAWKSLEPFEPPEKWQDPDDRMNAARLIESLGGRKRARQMYFSTWRHKEERHAAREEMFWEMLEFRGAFLTWQWLARNPPDSREGEDAARDHFGYRAYLLTQLRDYQRAAAELEKGLQIKPDCHWFLLLKSNLFSAQDQRERALAVVQEIVAKDPTYVAAVSDLAGLLTDLQRDDESVAALRSGVEKTQSARLAAELVNLLTETDAYDEAESALDLYEKYSPLRETRGDDWIAGRRCDIASHRGDQQEALKWAARVQKTGFYKLVAEKLKAAQPGLRRKVLAVPFIRQHDVTCAPASLTSIAHYWGHDVLHLDLANEICYDGTPDYREREWAERNGWATREFRVTVEGARSLIDAGMPFVLNTVHPGGAHAQVVMGYDEFRTVLFIRDPGNRNTTEFLAAEALAEQEPFGPRGFVMVPPPEADRLKALPLEDGDLYEVRHAINLALHAHDRERAAQQLEVLRERWPNHPLRWHGELLVSRYDGTDSQSLACLEELLKLHPDVVNWQSERVHLIADVRGREAMLAELRRLCAAKHSHPILWRMLVRQLQFDHRHLPEASRWLRRVHRHRLEGDALLAQATIFWDSGNRAEATELYRLASCQSPRSRSLALSYFRAARWTGQVEEALSLLRQRYEEEGHLSGNPAATLAEALDELNLAAESLAVLKESVTRRPDDADHAMLVAGELALWGQTEAARAILEKTPKAARKEDWHRVQARLARRAGDPLLELEHWRAVAALSPLDATAQREIAWLLEKQEGAKAASAYLRSVCERFPCNWHLHRTLLTWLREEGSESWEEAARLLLRIDPANAWAQRELADALRAGRKFDEAHAALDAAAQLEPEHAGLFAIRASVLEDQGKLAEAMAAGRESLQCDVDNTYSLRLLVRLSRSQEERLEALKFIQKELEKQTTFGDAVLEFPRVARPYLDEEELLQFLRQGRQARPDLWHTGVTLAEQLRHMGRFEEAVALTKELVDRFPLMPRIWHELGLSLAGAERQTEALEAMGKIRELNPGWTVGMTELAVQLQKQGEVDQAREVLEQGIRHSPQHAPFYGILGEICWRGGERLRALELLKRAVEVDPQYGWGWDRLAEWSKAVGREEMRSEALQQLLRERPRDMRSWLMYAESLEEAGQLNERLDALDRAAECAPEAWEPPDEKARVLSVAGRYEEALRLCRTHPCRAVELRVREAWILHRKGQFEEAVKVMDAALADDPGQVWGWELLVEWHKQKENFPLAEAALRQLSRLQPRKPVHLGYLAELQLARKDEEAAIATLQQSLKVSADYQFGIVTLFRLYLQRSDLQAAADLLSRSRPHLTPLEYLARRFALDTRLKRWQECRGTLTAILADAEDDSYEFARVANDLQLLPKSEVSACARLISRALAERNGVNVNTARLYVRCMEALKRLPEKAFVSSLERNSESGKRALISYLDLLAQRWSAGRKEALKLFGLPERWRFRALVKAEPQWLREDPGLYGQIGYVLHTMRRYRETAQWLADWRERDDLEPYMINNLVFSLQMLGRAEEAAAVIQHGLTLSDHNDSKMRCHIWTAIEHALNGEQVSAAEQLDAVNPASLDGYGKTLLEFAEVLMWYQDPEADPPCFDGDAEIRVTSFLQRHKKNRVMRDAVRRACRLFARRLGSSKPMWWWYRQRYGTAVGWAVGIGIFLYLRLIAV
jgi:tetratricopeptide (TPR) repeat protein